MTRYVIGPGSSWCPALLLLTALAGRVSLAYRSADGEGARGETSGASCGCARRAQIAAWVAERRLGRGAGSVVHLTYAPGRTGAVGETAESPAVHPIAPEAWPLVASRHDPRHQAGPLCGGPRTRCPQIAAPLDPPLAAARRESPARSPATARGEGHPRQAARRVAGADPAGPTRPRPRFCPPPSP